MKLPDFNPAPPGFKPRRKEVDLRLVPAGFGALILVGTILLSLPWAHQEGVKVNLLDALFLSTAATCVTGLTTVNVAEVFNPFGQVVLLILFQTGGLGIITASILLVLASGNRLSLSDEVTIRASVGRLQQARPFDVFIYACFFVVVLELAGMIALFSQMSAAQPEVGVGRTLWEAAFHSVSAFCNAGITIYPEGMARWRDHPGILAVIALLVIAGGIGLMTLINLRYYYFWRRDPRRRGRLTMHTRLALLTAAVLLCFGTLTTWAFEFNHTLANSTVGDGFTWSFFHSVMSRSGGLSVVDPGAMNPPTLLTTMGLMFIGGAPGSMAGGIKTATFAILVLTAWSAIRRREEIQFWQRRIPTRISHIATMIALLGAAAVLLGVGLLMFSEHGQPAAQTSQSWLGLMFEAVSAFCTVGLSTGVTPLLTWTGKLIIIVLMFVGRISPLLLTLYLARPANPLRVRHPQEELSLG